MSDSRCPGQDLRYWKPEDISTAACPACGALIEFWKDEPICVCPSCHIEARNPGISAGCAGHCPRGSDCGHVRPLLPPDPPV